MGLGDVTQLVENLSIGLGRLEVCLVPPKPGTVAQVYQPSSTAQFHSQAAWPVYSSASMTTAMSSAWYHSLFQKCFTNTY